jgi:hypothetical protein
MAYTINIPSGRGPGTFEDPETKRGRISKKAFPPWWKHRDSTATNGAAAPMSGWLLLGSAGLLLWFFTRK